MRDLNKVFLIGRLGKDPEKRVTKNGATVVHFSLATSRWISPAPGSGSEEGREETSWHSVSVWGRQGETCAQYLKKGDAVHVEGQVRTRKYQDKGGEDRYFT